MKKLNEGPTVHSDHRGHHLRNADGEIVQSFKKDREGLKHARQSMYKNFKGLSMKKPEPEQPVEETINEDSYSQYVELAKRNNATTYEQVIDLLSQQGLSEEEMYNIADYIMNVIEESQQTTEDRKMSELENKLKEQLEEGIVVNTTSDSDPNVEDTINVSAQGEDALELMAMLKMAGIGSQEAEVEAPAEETPCSASNNIDDMANMIKIIPLDDIEAVEEEVELANAPDEKYADTDTLVNKISGGLNRQKKSYAKAEDGDNPMAVESDESDTKYIDNKPLDEFSLEELEAERDRLMLKIKVFPTSSTDEHRARLEAVLGLINEINTSQDDNLSKKHKALQSMQKFGKLDKTIARMKAKEEDRLNNESVQVTESEEELTARLLKEYDEFKVTAPEDSDEGDWEIENVGKWAVKIGNSQDTKATNAELGFDTELAGVLADEAMAEAEDTDLVEDDVEEGLRMEFPDGSCEGSKCPDERNRRKKPKSLDKDAGDETPDALDKEMSEDKESK